MVYTELYEYIAKWSPATGYWQQKSNSGSRVGPGSIEIEVFKKCENHNLHYWRGTAFAHTVIGSTSYVGTNRKYRYKDCGW